MANELATAVPTTTAKAAKTPKEPKSDAPKVASANIRDAIKAAKSGTLTGAALEAAKKALGGLTQSSQTSEKGHWQNGIPKGIYSDCYKEDGSLDTFMNSETSAVRKVSGRWIVDKAGRRYKLYNVYLKHLPVGGTSNSGFSYIPALDFLSIENANFGILATEDKEGTPYNSNGKDYYPIVHSLMD